MGSIGALCCALGARKISVGRRIILRIIIMKRTNGVRTAYDAFLLRELQVSFGCAADFNTAKEAYPWPLIVPCHRQLASFAEAC